MATFEQIEREIVALEQAVKALAVEFHSAYSSYLTVLGKAVRQALILASYHLCTQGYAETFLSLPFSQRQQLQQDIRRLGQQAIEELLTGINTERERETSEDGKISPIASNPMSLAQWQQNLETAIAHTLKTCSREANRLLQQVGILPNKLPEPLLEAAASAEASADAVAGPPNLLNLLVETENNDPESEDSRVAHIVAIHLRLSEIEFADAAVRTGRNQIRHLLLKLNSLGREYHKKQRERTVAEAEAAWRASWFDN